MNRERILKLADFIEQLPPKRFNMKFWATQTDPDGELRSVAPGQIDPHTCGTAGCIAGWAIYLFGSEEDKASDYDIEGTASHILEMSSWCASDLFYGIWARGKVREDITQAETVAYLRKLAA